MIPKPLSKDDILRAMNVTRSNKGAARYLHCSYVHYKRYAQLYKDEVTGRSLFDIHKNQSGKGIPKFLKNKGKNPPLKDILEGRISIDHFEPSKIRDRLIFEGYLHERCYKCNFAERRVIDYKIPLLVHFKDSNKRNWDLTNVEMLCYNCYYLFVGDIFTSKQIQGIEDYKPIFKGEVDWELDDHFKEHFKDLGLMDSNEDDGSEFISRL
jgi:hypothetical protein